jgi:hypothetical protein
VSCHDCLMPLTVTSMVTCCRCGMKLSEHASLNGPLSESDLVDIAGQVGSGKAARVVHSSSAPSG